jgi:hypothetical protein
MLPGKKMVQRASDELRKPTPMRPHGHANADQAMGIAKDLGKLRASCSDCVRMSPHMNASLQFYLIFVGPSPLDFGVGEAKVIAHRQRLQELDVGHLRNVVDWRRCALTLSREDLDWLEAAIRISLPRLHVPYLILVLRAGGGSESGA